MSKFGKGDRVKIVNCECLEANGLIGTIVGKAIGTYGDYFVNVAKEKRVLGKWTTHIGDDQLKKPTGLDIKRENLVKYHDITDLLKEVNRKV